MLLRILALFILWSLSFYAHANSSACESALAVTTVTKATSRAQFEEFLQLRLPQWFKEFKHVYGDTDVKKFVSKSEYSEFLKVYFDQQDLLLQKTNSGELSFEVLARFGIHSQGPAGFVYPESYLALASNISRALIEKAIHSQLQIDDVLLPGIPVLMDKKVVFLKPGVDPIPVKSEGPKFLDMDQGMQNKIVELGVGPFSQAVARGTFPFPPSMTYHDVFHFVDFYEKPGYMKALSEFYKLENSQRDLQTDYKISLGNIQHSQRVQYLWTEFSALPKLQPKKAIDQVFGADQRLLVDPPTILKKYQKLTDSELTQAFFKIEKHLPQLIEFTGGGYRDGYNLVRALSKENFYWHMVKILGGEPRVVGVTPNLIAAEDLYGVYWIAKIAQQWLDKNPRPFLPPQLLLDLLQFQVLKKADVTEQELQAAARKLLVDSLAKFESIVRTGNFMSFNTTQIVKDLNLLFAPGGASLFARSKTFKYFERTTETGDFSRKVFVIPFMEVD